MIVAGEVLGQAAESLPRADSMTRGEVVRQLQAEYELTDQLSDHASYQSCSSQVCTHCLLIISHAFTLVQCYCNAV